MFQYLSFSDAAKYADIARNLIFGLGYGNSFSFWSSSLFEPSKYNIFSTISIPPVMPFSITASFKIFGVNDFAVMATSFFYFILTLAFAFLLARKVFRSNLIGVLSTLAVGFNNDLINYAANGASESPFIFEIIAAAYFISIKKKWGSFVALIFTILMYFTRPQAFIYIAGLVLYWLLVNFKFKKAIIYFTVTSIVCLLVDKFILGPLSGKYFLYSIVDRGLGSSFSQSSTASNALRGGTSLVANGNGIVQVLKNVFYNLYNFYKLLPQIMSPYFFTLFTIGIFKWGKDKTQNPFKTAAIFMIAITFLVVAMSIPFFRYLHPIVPLVYIIAVGTLVEILELGFKNNYLKIPRNLLINLISIIIILIFGVGQTLGILILDSRFEKNMHNAGKPPLYVELSKILKGNTKLNDIVITNLDTWGSWYGERKTVWFPLEPKQLINPATGKIPFDAIYLTSYKIDDENYYMGRGWRMIFDNPSNPKKWTCDGCSEIAKEFTLKGVYKISAADNYERQDASGILLVRKH
jgi:4-amino-4-deoxy-L-arabinose transferase-like glycosyltransferase